MEDIDELGSTELVLRVMENQLQSRLNEVKRQRQHRAICVDEFMCQFWAIEVGLETRIGMRVETNWPVLTWIVEHARMMLNR